MSQKEALNFFIATVQFEFGALNMGDARYMVYSLLSRSNQDGIYQLAVVEG